MKRQNPSVKTTREAKCSAEAQLREQGLRILARIAARVYLSQIVPQIEDEQADSHAEGMES
jgi:hypothetical protein